MSSFKEDLKELINAKGNKSKLCEDACHIYQMDDARERHNNKLVGQENQLAKEAVIPTELLNSTVNFKRVS